MVAMAIAPYRRDLMLRLPVFMEVLER